MTTTNLVIQSQDPAVVISALLNHLEILNGNGLDRARVLRQSYGPTLAALSNDLLPRPSEREISDLLASLTREINALISEDDLLHGRYFGQRELGAWGWWDERRRTPRFSD